MIELQSKIKDFTEYLNYEQNASQNTLKTYQLTLNQFINWLQSQKFKEVNHLIIQGFVKYLRKEKKNGANSIAQKLATLKSFFNYLSSLNIEVPQIRANYKRVKKTVLSLSSQELELILNKARLNCEQSYEALHRATGKTKLLKKQYAGSYRDLVGLLILAATGLRASELCGINMDDLDLKRGEIIVNGKGKKQRQVYIDLPEIKEPLEKYFKLRHKLSPRVNAVFLNLKNGERLSVRGLQYIVKKYAKIIGGNKKITPHIMRHTFASLSIEKGANIKAISQILGHSNVKTTLNMYTHLSEEHIRKVLQGCNPLTGEGLSLKEAVNARRESLIYMDNPKEQSKYG